MSDIADLRALARSRISLLSAIAEAVDLEPAEPDLRGACPFHPDVSRSLYVSSKGNFYCFSCGGGGDVVAWTMRVHQIGEAAAIDRLLRR
jgi:DNA primase